MDARHFDALVQALSTPESRRRLLALLATVPLFGGVVSALSTDDAEGAGRRKRRKKAHKHGKGRHRKQKRKKQCRPDSTAQTCAGRCGSVTNNCDRGIDCGSCACTPACDACFVCQDQGPNLPGACVVDPAQQGDACGDGGQVCQGDGTCACPGGTADCGGTCTPLGTDTHCASCTDSCATCQTCVGGACAPATNDVVCGTQSGGGALRCCNGTCPDPTCRPAGTPCLPGEDALTCRLQCCSLNRSGVTNACQGNSPDPNSNFCGSDADCRPEFGATCRCGRCCLGSGQEAYLSDCRTCCSGACQAGTTTCA